MLLSYQSLISQPECAPSRWQVACTHSESTLHQLSPYIGKLKSSIAHDLIAEYSRKGEMVALRRFLRKWYSGTGIRADGAAVVRRRCEPLRDNPNKGHFHRRNCGRRVILTRRTRHLTAWRKRSSLFAARSREVDIRKVPMWVRDFYHPDTLKEMLQLLDFPAEHWKHVRTTNPIESTFATVRLRTYRTKGCLSRKTAMAMVFKLCQCAQRKMEKTRWIEPSRRDHSRRQIRRWRTPGSRRRMRYCVNVGIISCWPVCSVFLTISVPDSSLILVVISYPILDPENFLEMTIPRCTHIGAWSLASEQRLHAH